MNWSLSGLVKSFLIEVFSYLTIVNFQVTRSFTRGYNYMWCLCLDLLKVLLSSSCMG